MAQTLLASAVAWCRWPAAAVAVLGVSLWAQAPPPPADLVLVNGSVYTVDAARSWAQAVAVRGPRIVAVGADRDIAAYVGPATRRIDLEGRFVLPGFHDSHVHPLSGGVELGQCNLNGLASREAVFARIADCARQGAPGWIVGGGFDLPLFQNGSPTRDDLDRLVPDRPAFLTSSDGHSAWVNSRALALAEVDRRTADPAGGRIERRENGDPSGTLRETAMDLMARHLPVLTARDHDDGLRRGLAMAARFGVTALVEASASPAYLDAYLRAAAGDTLTARVLVSQRVDASADAATIASLADRARRAAGPRLRADAAKLFVDGVIEAGTAALLEPYAGGDDRGELNFTPDDLARIATLLYRERIQLHAHAIGDRAIRTTLDAIAAADGAADWSDPRPHIAHIQLISPSDIPRFRDLRVIANIQALWAYADAFITDLTEPRLGPDRSRWLYPNRALFDSGAVVVGGSDWSVSSMNPLEAIRVGITRQGLGDSGAVAWLPDQRASLPGMLAAYTINGAYLQRRERDAGSLETGKLADLIVLDRNLFAMPVHDIHRARVVLTLLDGSPTWSDGTLLPATP